MHELSARQLRYLTEVDHHTHEALVAIDVASANGIGVARFIRSTTDPTAAEAAVAVLDNWQGRAVGTALLHTLAARAREEGVERFTASVLAANSPMLELVRRLSDTAVIESTGTVAEVQVKFTAAGSRPLSRTPCAWPREARSKFTRGTPWHRHR